MSRRCDIIGVRAQYGNKVSHAKNRTRRRFEVNLCRKRLYSEHLSKFFNLRVSAHGLRTVEHFGGLDSFLLNSRSSSLSDRCKALLKLLTNRHNFTPLEKTEQKTEQKTE